MCKWEFQNNFFSTLLKFCLKLQVINVHDCPTIYHVPLVLNKQGLVQLLTNQLCLSVPTPTKKFMHKWRSLAERAEHLRKVCSKIFLYNIDAT